MLINDTLPNPNYNINVTVDPTVEPVTVTELKEFARIDGTDEDTLLGTIIISVRQAMELFLRRALVEQTIQMTFDFWDVEMIELARPPLLSISKVFTLDEDDTETTYSSTNYYTITEAIPGKIVIKQGATLPTNTTRDVAGFGIEYLAGYGSQASDVPELIRTCLMEWGTMVYENRAECTKVPIEIQSKLHLYRVIEI
jgi:uncharacterized phiE125 gp8 family phage protein